MIEAFHLPSLRDPPTTGWGYGDAGNGLELRIPQLTPDLLQRQIDSLVEARERELAGRPVAEIVAVIDQVAARLLDPDDQLRRCAESALPLVTGTSPEMVARVLDGMASDWRRPRLESLLECEFARPSVLDGWTAGAGGTWVRALGPRLTTHFFSGNIPGIAVTSLVRSLLVKSASLGKTGVGDPVLPALFARGIAEADAGLGRCIAVTYWPGGDEALERVALSRPDAVIVYGGDEAIAGVRARTPPTARFIGYGHKVSFGVVAREALEHGEAASTAEAAALEIATFDQQGCVSPHLFYVETGGAVSPAEWARLLAGSLAALEEELPRGSLSPGESAAIRQIRGAAEFAQISGSGVELHASPDGTAWTVIHDPDPSFEASCLNRVVRVKPIGDLMEVPEHTRGLGRLLQTVGVVGPPERIGLLAARLADAGASRIAPIGTMAWPPPTWHHDGRPPLRDLVRWCDWERP